MLSVAARRRRGAPKRRSYGDRGTFSVQKGDEVGHSVRVEVARALEMLHDDLAHGAASVHLPHELASHTSSWKWISCRGLAIMA